MSTRLLFLCAVWTGIAIAGIGTLVDRGSAEVPEALLWRPSDDSTVGAGADRAADGAATEDDAGTGKDEAMAQATKQKNSKLPPIDLAAPKEIETATFALG